MLLIIEVAISEVGMRSGVRSKKQKCENENMYVCEKSSCFLFRNLDIDKIDRNSRCKILMLSAETEDMDGISGNIDTSAIVGDRRESSNQLWLV